MSSRQEQKELRRQERLEREAAEAKSAANRRRVQLVGGGVLAVAALAAVVVAVAVAVGGSDGPKQPEGGDSSREAAQSLPAQKVTELGAAAKAAGCKVTNAEYEGASHEDRTFTPADYKTNPPTSGNHNPNWYEDGIYEPGNTPKLGELVHTLEHGRIDVQYKPGTPKSVTDQLEAFVGENDGYHMLMFENTTKMSYAVSATAWTQMVGCDEMSPEVFDALRTFRDRYIDKGPEKKP